MTTGNLPELRLHIHQLPRGCVGVCNRRACPCTKVWFSVCMGVLKMLSSFLQRYTAMCLPPPPPPTQRKAVTASRKASLPSVLLLLLLLLLSPLCTTAAPQE